MAGGIIGSIAQPVAAHFAQKRQHKYVKKYMKNKYQWEVADLIAAGLNPILGYTKGGPPIGAAGIPNISIGGVEASAIGAMKVRAELKLLKAQTEKLSAEAAQATSRSKKLDLEVMEFPPTPGGVARRFLESGRLKSFIKDVGDVPKWISDRLKSVAPR